MRRDTTKKRIFGLDCLRAIAILLVLLSHSALLVAPNDNGIIITVIKLFGATGVDIFFVLSGFLIGRIILRRIVRKQMDWNGLLRFWKRRWMRTLPNYYLILVINIFLWFLYNGRFPEQVWKYFVFLQNFNEGQSDFFSESWSLSIEEYAYLILPFLITLFTAKYGRKIAYFVVTLLVILMLNLLKWNYFNTYEVADYYDWSHSFRKVVIYRLDAIYIGFLLAYLWNEYRTLLIRNRFFLANLGIGLFIVLHLYLLISQTTPNTGRVFFVFIYLPLVSVSIALTFSFFMQLLFISPFKKQITWISKISYSLYLVNYSIVLISLQHFFNVEQLHFLPKVGVFMLFWVVTFILSNFLYKQFESPVLKLRDKIYP